jgi:hypothetical protein
MRQFGSAIPLAVLLVIATGCATGGADVGSAGTQSDVSASIRAADLEGTWRGSFGQVMTGDSGQIHGDILTKINGDGTYKTTWTTRLVAGSARGGQLEMTGTVVPNGSRVMFNDARSGGRMTLVREGDTLYGTTIDPATKRVTVAVELHKVPSTEAP